MEVDCFFVVAEVQKYTHGNISFKGPRASSSRLHTDAAVSISRLVGKKSCLTLCEISQWKTDIHSWQLALQLMFTSCYNNSMAEHTVVQRQQK